MGNRLADGIAGVLASLADAGETTWAALQEVLENAEETFETDQLVEKAGKALPDELDPTEVLNALLHIYNRQDAPGMTRQKALDMCRSAAGGDDAAKGFEAFIGRILDLRGAFGLAAKALVLRSDNSAVANDARIITDVRPAFAPGGTDLMGAAVQQTLRIAYEQGGTVHARYFVASEVQLRHLRTAIDRALKKAESVREKFGADVRFMEE